MCRIPVPSFVQILQFDEVSNAVWVAAIRLWVTFLVASGQPRLRSSFIAPLLNDRNLGFCPLREADALDPVAELAMDATAILADKCLEVQADISGPTLSAVCAAPVCH
jgi:hypothetical protein